MMVLKTIFVYVVRIPILGTIACTPTRHYMLNAGYQSKQSMSEEGPRTCITRSSTQNTMLSTISSEADQPKSTICTICKKKDDGNGFSLCKDDHVVCLSCWEQEVYNRCLSVRPYRCLICKKEQKIATELIDLLMQACKKNDLRCIQSIILPLEKLIICAMIIGKYPFNESVESDSFLVADHLLNLNFWSTRLLNITNSDFIYSPLYKAIEYNNIHLAHKLLKKGVDPNQQFGFDLKTPLHVAIFNIAIGIVELLIQYKANVNCVCNFKRTPLWYAVIKKSPEIVKYLLKNKACIDQEDTLGRTALYAAIEQADVHMVHLLITNGASVNHRDRQGISPLAYALYLNDQIVLLEANKKKSTTYLFESRKRGRSVLPTELPSSSKGRNKHSSAQDLEELRHLPNQRGQICELLIKYGSYIEG